MAIEIVGAVSGVEAEVDLNRSLQVVEFDEAGNPVVRAPNSVYSVGFGLRLSAAIAAGATVFALTNTGTENVYIRKIFAQTGFAGTAAATAAIWSIRRITGGTPTGGTALTPAPFDVTYPATSVGDVRYNIAATLTMGTATPGDPIAMLMCGRQLNVGYSEVLEFEGEDRILLAPTEGLIIYLDLVSVIGDFISGAIEWEEFTP